MDDIGATIKCVDKQNSSPAFVEFLTITRKGQRQEAEAFVLFFYYIWLCLSRVWDTERNSNTHAHRPPSQFNWRNVNLYLFYHSTEILTFPCIQHDSLAHTPTQAHSHVVYVSHKWVTFDVWQGESQAVYVWIEWIAWSGQIPVISKRVMMV